MAQLVIPCGVEQFFAKSRSFQFSMRYHTYGNQAIKAKIGSDVLLDKNVLSGSINELALNVPLTYCQNRAVTLLLEISNPRSPFDQGESSDRRKLGMAFTEFEIK